MRNMEINSICSDRNLLIQLSGELDHNGAKDAIQQMEYALDAALPKKLVLDFTGITFMDSSGIALILRAKRRINLQGGSVYVCHVPPQARRVLSTAGIGHLVVIQENTEEAEQ